MRVIIALYILGYLVIGGLVTIGAGKVIHYGMNGKEDQE